MDRVVRMFTQNTLWVDGLGFISLPVPVLFSSDLVRPRGRCPHDASLPIAAMSLGRLPTKRKTARLEVYCDYI